MTKVKNVFSLIEFFVVVAILLIVTSILLPSLNRVFETSNSAACKNNLKHISLVNHLYADEYDDRFIPIRDRNSNNKTRDWQEIMADLELYPIKNSDALCPTKPMYGLNQTTHGGNKRVTIARPIIRHKLIEPSEKIQGGDCTKYIMYRKRIDPNQPLGWLALGEGAFRSLGYRHLDKANVFYFDGRVGEFDMYFYKELVHQLRYSRWSFD